MKSSEFKTEKLVKPLNPRQVALDVCLSVVSKGQSLNDLLEKHLTRIDSVKDRSFCSELCYGFCRYYFVLQSVLSQLLKKPLKPRDQDVQVILLLGLYQIRFMRVENHAAVNETVKLINVRKKTWAKGLVNAVLRSYIREKITLGNDDQAQLTSQEFELAYPQWITRKIHQDWPQQYSTVLAAGNQQAPMVLRVNHAKMSAHDYVKLLSEHSLPAHQHPLVEQAVVLDKAVGIENLPGFFEGWVSVQDAASQLAADLLMLEPGIRVLDACAAPGGKTLHIMQTEEDLHLTAIDKEQGRLQRVHDNLRRGTVAAKVICADAVHSQDWFDSHLFDRILLDAPCSASGIIRRHPDIRLLRQSGDIAALVKQQQRLLNAMWELLKPGGVLLYSTCSIFKDENEHQIQAFRQNHRNCIELPINNVQWGFQRQTGRQILPGFNEMDGFYYARLSKQP